MADHYFEVQRCFESSFGELEVLKHVSFFVNQGETGVILGRSGVGKSVSLEVASWISSIPIKAGSS